MVAFVSSIAVGIEAPSLLLLARICQTSVRWRPKTRHRDDGIAPSLGSRESRAGLGEFELLGQVALPSRRRTFAKQMLARDTIQQAKLWHGHANSCYSNNKTLGATDQRGIRW